MTDPKLRSSLPEKQGSPDSECAIHPFRTGAGMKSVAASKGRYAGSYLRDFARYVFESSGVSTEDAIQTADVLCTADEWGIRSHGLARLRFYHEMLADGRINPKAKPTITKELLATAQVDGDNGLGPVVAAFANRVAMERAKERGMYWVTVRNSNHFGIAGYYAAQGLHEDLIGISMTNTPAVVAPFGGVQRRLGSNPIAVAFPAAEEPSIIVDMSTTATSFGQVEILAREGKELPQDCILDATGRSSRNPHDLFENGSLLPLGSTQFTGGHKGYCLAAIIDLLCGVLPGASWGPFVPSFIASSPLADKNVGKGVGHFFGSIWAGAFEDAEHVRERADQWIRTMRNTKPAEWSDGVVIPGARALHSAADSKRRGIYLDAKVQEDLRSLSESLNLAFDFRAA
jgi:L-2-hydroxycarboxylate dehydrogenase (NAD+)